jgi:ferredoxin-NADP reductase
LDRLEPVVQKAPGQWQVATVAAVRGETPTVKTFRFELPMAVPHMPGQHYDIRLTADDGYVAQRSYSIASPWMDDGAIELTIDRLDDGEVSPYLHDVVVEGDQLELRGPFGGYFVWRGQAPALLIGGGSGVVPLMCMLRHKRRAAPSVTMKLVYSVRNAFDVIYRDELSDDTDVSLTFTKVPPPGWEGPTGRIDAAIVDAALEPMATVFICGTNGFAEAASQLVLAAGVAPERILTERFGPTG